jgi:hypothetical protein
MKPKFEHVIPESEVKTKLWREFLTNYRRGLEARPDKFTNYAETFRDRRAVIARRFALHHLPDQGDNVFLFRAREGK